MVRCPACGNENPPEYPPEEYPFCIECGAQLGSYRPGPQPADPYGQPNPLPPAGPYGQPQYGPPPRQDPYGRPDPYGQPDLYGQRGQQPDPYAAPAGPPPYGGAYPGPADPYPGGRAETPYLPAGPGPARLILESSAGQIEYPLDAPVVTIGRSRSNDISLEDVRVSRHHARIVRDQRGYTVEDLNSRNGTRVDDRAVREAVPLRDGAVLRIGDSAFRFAASSPPGGPVPHADRSAPYGGQPPRAAVPEVFSAPWSPVQCPTCQGLKTMRPVIYGPAAQSPGAQVAAQRGEVALGEGPPRPDAPNAECRACGTRVRIVTTGG